MRGRKTDSKQTLDDQEKIVLQDQGTVKLDEGIVQYDKVQVAFCHITAPITGGWGCGWWIRKRRAGEWDNRWW